jgi:hypothetical protein
VQSLNLMSSVRAVALCILMMGCSDAPTPTAPLHPAPTSTADLGAGECLIWVEGCADVAPNRNYYQTGGGGGLEYSEEGGPLYPMSFDVTGTYRGHRYEATAFRDWFSSTYEAFFLATDNSGCSGFMVIDLSVMEATMLAVNGRVMLGSYRMEGVENC